MFCLPAGVAFAMCSARRCRVFGVRLFPRGLDLALQAACCPPFRAIYALVSGDKIPFAEDLHYYIWRGMDLCLLLQRREMEAQESPITPGIVNKFN